MQIIGFIFHLFFLLFFYRLGLSWLMLFPLLAFFLQFVRQGGVHLSDGDRQEYFKANLFKDGIVIAWVLIMIGIMGIFDMYGVNKSEIAIDLILVNIAGWFATTWLNNKDGMKSFHVGLYVALFLLLFFMPRYGVMTNFLIIGAFLSLLTACYSFMMFIIKPLEKDMSQFWGFLLLLYSLISLIYLIFCYSYRDLYLMVVLGQVLLLLMYIAVYCIQRYSYRVGRFHDHEEDAFLRVLSGRRLHEMKTIQEVDVLLGLDTFVQGLSGEQKSLIGRLNVLLMLAQVIVFLRNIGDGIIRIRQLVFWFGIIVFFVNYMLLRNIGFPHRFQRIVAFVMLNFGVYITLVNIFGSNIQQIVAFGMVWSLMSSAIMASSDGIQTSLKLTREDYITRAIANVFASLCNLYFIIMLPFTGQLRFSLAFFYLGFQLFLVLFGVKKVMKSNF